MGTGRDSAVLTLVDLPTDAKKKQEMPVEFQSMVQQSGKHGIVTLTSRIILLNERKSIVEAPSREAFSAFPRVAGLR